MLKGKKVYIETYGCQMNVADSEVVRSILDAAGCAACGSPDEADYVLINTCAIRDNAEQKIHRRLRDLRTAQQQRKFHIGVIGCMAERLKQQLMLEAENVSFVVGPDAYRKLADVMERVAKGDKVAETDLSATETYSDIQPVRLDGNGISAYISIMRGCQNYCAYCVVPYTRGRERSRDAASIVHEARTLFDHGYREVTLLGQNVNSYRSADVSFAQLMARVADISPLLRVRFATSHPKDLSDELLATMAAYPNICKCIHLPLQSGSNRMLKLMNRKYTAEWYLDRIDAIRRFMPDCSITTDVIAGFCGETEADHQATLDIFGRVAYDYAYMFKFSMRPDTSAAKHLNDDVPDPIKSRRLEEIIKLQGEIALRNNQRDIGQRFEVLVEGASHRSKEQLFGRNSQNKVIVFDRGNATAGTYATVEVTSCTAATLIGRLVEKT